MSGLGDALISAYTADEQRARGRTRDPHRTIAAIRRRRTVRAAGTGTAAVFGVAALGAIWLFAPGGGDFSPAAPSTECTDAQLYLPPNPDALGDVELLYRAYVDIRPDSPTHGVVVVQQDGTLVRVEPGPDGDYMYEGMPLVFVDDPDEIKYRPMVWDMGESSGGGDNWDGVSPHTNDYEWTIVIPSQVPAGVNTKLLSSTLRIAIGSGGSGYLPGSVPAGAVTDQVLTTTTGATEVARLYDGDPGISIEGRTDVASIAMRVTLEGGETFTMTAEHHEVDPALTECASASDSVSVTATPTGTPSPAPTGVIPGSSPEPGVSQGGAPTALAGPESEVFACGDPLPPELEGTLGLDVSWESGTKVYETLAGSQEVSVDLGSGGAMVTGALPGGPPAPGNLSSPNWALRADDSSSLAIFSAAVAVRDGVIIGVVPPQAEDAAESVPSDAFHLGGTSSAGSDEAIAMSIPNVEARMRACEGVDASDLEGGDTVLLLGAGPASGPYDFAWTRLDRP